MCYQATALAENRDGKAHIVRQCIAFYVALAPHRVRRDAWARCAKRCATSTGALGSPGFVAPEIADDGVHAPPMDMFSLGVVLFIMLVSTAAETAVEQTKYTKRGNFHV